MFENIVNAGQNINNRVLALEQNPFLRTIDPMSLKVSDALVGSDETDQGVINFQSATSNTQFNSIADGEIFLYDQTVTVSGLNTNGRGGLRGTSGVGRFKIDLSDFSDLVISKIELEVTKPTATGNLTPTIFVEREFIKSVGAMNYTPEKFTHTIPITTSANVAMMITIQNPGRHILISGNPDSTAACGIVRIRVYTKQFDVSLNIPTEPRWITYLDMPTFLPKYMTIENGENGTITPQQYLDFAPSGNSSNGESKAIINLVSSSGVGETGIDMWNFSGEWAMIHDTGLSTSDIMSDIDIRFYGENVSHYVRVWVRFQTSVPLDLTTVSIYSGDTLETATLRATRGVNGVSGVAGGYIEILATKYSDLFYIDFEVILKNSDKQELHRDAFSQQISQGAQSVMTDLNRYRLQYGVSSQPQAIVVMHQEYAKLESYGIPLDQQPTPV